MYRGFDKNVHCKKRLAVSLKLKKISLPGIVKLFSARESLVNDILDGDGKTINLFYSVGLQ